MQITILFWAEETENTALEYRPQMDLARFQRLINELDKEKVNGNNDALKTARLILNHVEQDARKKPAGTGKLNIEMMEWFYSCYIRKI